MGGYVHVCWPIVKLAHHIECWQKCWVQRSSEGILKMTWPHLSERRASCCCQVGPSVVNNHCVLVGVACSFLPHYVLMEKAGLSLTREPKGILLTVSGLKGVDFQSQLHLQKNWPVWQSRKLLDKDILLSLMHPVFWIKKKQSEEVLLYSMYGIWMSQTTWNKAFEQ